MSALALPRHADTAAWRAVAAPILGSFLLAAFAQVAIPFGPVPITGQTFAILLLGVLLGSRGAAAAALLYLVEGAAGLPVFAGFSGGAHVLLGPTAGYILAFVPGAWLAGRLVELRWNRSLLGSVAAMLLVHLLILTAGAAWLAFFIGVGSAAQFGLAVFIPVAMVKTALALPVYWQPRHRD